MLSQVDKHSKITLNKQLIDTDADFKEILLWWMLIQTGPLIVPECL